MNYFIMLRSRFETMSPSDQFWAIFHAGIDALLLIFLGFAVYVGLTTDFNIFFFWVPFLGVVAWFRWKQAKHRWALR